MLSSPLFLLFPFSNCALCWICEVVIILIQVIVCVELCICVIKKKTKYDRCLSLTRFWWHQCLFILEKFDLLFRYFQGFSTCRRKNNIPKLAVHHWCTVQPKHWQKSPGITMWRFAMTYEIHAISRLGYGCVLKDVQDGIKSAPSAQVLTDKA